MSRACFHCGGIGKHDPRCIVAVVHERDERDLAHNWPPFTAARRAVMRGSACVATAVSHNFARRIANALNAYKPGSRGF